MNILHISHLYPVYYDLFWGKAVHNLIKSIASQGCKVQVVSPVPYTPFPINYLSKGWKLYSKIPNYEIIEGIEVYRPRYVAFPRALYFSSSGVRMYHGIKRLIKDLKALLSRGLGAITLVAKLNTLVRAWKHFLLRLAVISISVALKVTTSGLLYL